MENNTSPSDRDDSNSDVSTPADTRPAKSILSEPQIRALEWLTSGGSITEAAQFAGVARQTVSRWLKVDPDFCQIYDAWREQIMTMTDGQLSALAESAVATIADAVRNQRNVNAAQFVIRHLTGSSRRR